ncbi:DUF3575 domain-containing protein [Sphingobacterium mizutaii]|uniref:DUF3575 domain-containing protein n=1 Tax=Sphingobacterium mizutaii TaxID=1010 RepID=UPI00162AA9D3|nr:DUF3575 domain-containing protein [Sphingobacterium mizutaii]
MKNKNYLGLALLSITFALCLLPSLTLAQQNTVKFNLLPLVGKTFAFEYERMVAPKMSVNASIGFRGKSSLPFKKTIEELIEDENFTNDATLDHFTFSPEFRFYTSKNGDGGRGFYVGPFFKYGKYNITTNYPYETDQGTTETVPLKGGIGTWGFGFVIGSQFKLAKSVFMDLRILGPHYGGASGTISGKMDLSPQEQQYLREELENLQNDVVDIETTVDAQGASLKAKSPWGGIRAGISIGYRF